MKNGRKGRPAAPIFILGHPRSGTTLLRYIIDTHPKICCPAELQLGELCEHLYRIMELTAGRVTISDKEARRRQSIKKTRRIASRIMEDYCKAKDKPLWCEKSPGNLLYPGILQAVFPTARYICLLRHCLDVVSSCLQIWPLVSGSVPIFLQQHYDIEDRDMVSTVIHSWSDHTNRMLNLADEKPETYFPIKFESLITDPCPTLKRMFEFLGVEWDEKLIDAVFSTNHETGPGDLKVIASRGISKDRMGKGASVSVDHVRPSLLGSMNALLDRLGYPKHNPTPAVEAARAAPGGPAISDVNELFGSYFPRRLDKYAARVADLKGAVRFTLSGPRGGVWTVNLESKPCCFVTGGGAAQCSFSASPGDILDIVNRKLAPGEAFLDRKLLVEGDVELAEEVAWVLFG
jgi:protein-tyrosine sulfotransferase